jgi:mannose-6-phosphate isomerase-like protein (cupin superfamily)
VRLPERPGGREVAYQFESLDYAATERRFNSYHAEFFPVPEDKLRPHEHSGVEFIHTLQGTLSVHIAGEAHALEQGDSIYFDSSVPHAYRRSGGRVCSAVIVTAS